MKKAVIYLLLALVPMIDGCVSRRPVAQPPVQTIPLDKGQTWQLVSLRGKEWKLKKKTDLVFNPEAGTCRGFAACNTYFCHYSAKLISSTSEGDRYELSISMEGSGSLGCPDAEMNAEFRYLALLEKADSMLVTAYTLTLYQHGREILKYELQ